MSSRPPIAVPKPRPQAPPTSESPPARAAAAPARAVSGAAEATPPPADGYYDLVLDDSEPQAPKDAPAARASAPSPPRELPRPADAAAAASFLATAGKPASKRRLGPGALVAIAAVVVLFGAVGAMALKRPQRDEERVSRALLPRAEWVGSQASGTEPSAGMLAQLEEEDEPATAAEPGGQPRHRDRSRPRHASPRPVAVATPTGRPVPVQREQPAPAPQSAPAPTPPPAAAPPPAATPPPAVAAASPAPVETEDAPQFARQGFRSPSQETPNCVQSSVRIPRDLQGFASGPITVRFAVDKDGSVGRFRVEGQVPDPRIGEAIWSAVRECRFVPGADDQGRPVRLWVVMPIRFVR